MNKQTYPQGTYVTTQKKYAKGTSINVHKYILFLVNKYKNIVCSPLIFTKMTNGNRSKGLYFEQSGTLHRKLITSINPLHVLKCQKSKSRYIIIPFYLYSYTVGGHQNFLIYDKLSKTLEWFEPHGYTLANVPKLNISDKENEIVFIIENSLGLPVKSNKIIHSHLNSCSIGIQRIEAEQKKEKQIDGTNLLEDTGLCLMWNLWYLDLKFSNPGLNSRKLLANMLLKTNQTNFRQFIVEYTIFKQQLLKTQLPNLNKLHKFYNDKNTSFMLQQIKEHVNKLNIESIKSVQDIIQIFKQIGYDPRYFNSNNQILFFTKSDWILYNVLIQYLILKSSGKNSRLDVMYANLKKRDITELENMYHNKINNVLDIIKQ